MNREDIIRMARQCGFWLDGANQAMPMWVIKQEELERFAALVASAEREACAELIPPQYFELRDRIRARGQA